MTIDKITSPANQSIVNAKTNEIINTVNGFSTSFSTDDLFAPIIKGQDIITLTSDPTNSAGILVIAPDVFTYKDGNQDIHNIGYREDVYDDIGNSHTFSFEGYGHLTSSGTALYTFIPLPYKIPTGATVELSSFNCTVRGAGGSVSISSLSDVTSIVVAIRSEGAALQLTLNSSTKFTGYTNNNAYVTYGTMTYEVVADNS